MMAVRSAGVVLVALAAGAGGLFLYAAPDGRAARRPDAASGIVVTRATMSSATPSVSSADGVTRTAVGGARTSDGSVILREATVRAGGGYAVADASGLSVSGVVAAANATAVCDHGRVSWAVSADAAGSIDRHVEISYGIRSANNDGTVTITAMRVTVAALPGGGAATIDVAVATCAGSATSAAGSTAGSATATPGGTPTPSTAPADRMAPPTLESPPSWPPAGPSSPGATRLPVTG
ncbi:hypothetical protein [Dactylosporangium sp. NPDC049140]|uniref:hypothetical protein n=1 Tax=Dactylosporangium sp. NPDC049140 TaxID=3155647 RepID=UPI00340A19B5